MGNASSHAGAAARRFSLICASPAGLGARVAGLFGYHFFYFTALGIAPPADASLIAFLWPLLIVLLSALLPGERLRWWHLAGGVAGLVGAGLLVTRGGGMALRPEFMSAISRHSPVPSPGRYTRCSTAGSAKFRATRSAVSAASRRCSD